MTSLSIPCPSYDHIYRSGSHRFCAELDNNPSVFDKTGAFFFYLCRLNTSVSSVIFTLTQDMICCQGIRPFSAFPALFILRASDDTFTQLSVV